MGRECDLRCMCMSFPLSFSWSSSLMSSIARDWNFCEGKWFCHQFSSRGNNSSWSNRARSETETVTATRTKSAFAMEKAFLRCCRALPCLFCVCREECLITSWNRQYEDSSPLWLFASKNGLLSRSLFCWSRESKKYSIDDMVLPGCELIQCEINQNVRKMRQNGHNSFF